MVDLGTRQSAVKTQSDYCAVNFLMHGIFLNFIEWIDFHSSSFFISIIFHKFLMMSILNEIVDVVKNGNNIDFSCEIVSKGNRKLMNF